MEKKKQTKGINVSRHKFKNFELPKVKNPLKLKKVVKYNFSDDTIPLIGFLYLFGSIPFTIAGIIYLVNNFNKINGIGLESILLFLMFVIGIFSLIGVIIMLFIATERKVTYEEIEDEE